MQLQARIPNKAREVVVARLTEDPASPTRNYEALLVRGDARCDGRDFSAVLRVGSPAHDESEIPLPETFSYLATGDIVRITAGELRILYRRTSHHNVLFITERCNSRCLMCSQPPRDVNDEWLVDEMLQTIQLMSPETRELCITGGEPTLLGPRLLEVVHAVRRSLPHTALHMLSNGRLFAYTRTARAISKLEHPNFMIGIPLYSDVADRHDFVVQARGAFDQTIRGISNLARFEQKIEIRFVIHRQTARFIARNLPFVNQVALMGLEVMGFTKTNLEALWIDPFDYQQQLAEAVQILREAHVPVMIYNHPLCLLPRELWPFAVRSISDWKNIYLPECEPCRMKSSCGGFFASATVRHSQHITPFREAVD